MTGGAGFVGPTSALDLRNAVPSGASWRSTIFVGAGQSSICPDFARRRPIRPRDVRERGGLQYLVGTNLPGAINCLELCRHPESRLVFLSTSRVYPVGALSALRLAETATRFELEDEQPFAGASRDGIAEEFPLQGARTFSGATKLAAELLIAEYVVAFGLRAVVNRCGAIAGPWQMGKVDQGVVASWMLAHHFGRRLNYIGFGGTGKQVRDVHHVDDRVELDRGAAARAGPMDRTCVPNRE